MRDPRCSTLAQVIVRHSTRLEPGETILIEAFDLFDGLVVDLVEAVQKVGGVPYVVLKSNSVQRALLRQGAEAQFRLTGELDRQIIERMKAFVGLRGAHNISELSDVASERMKLYTQYVVKPVHIEYRVRHTKWVVLRYPGPAMAQQAGMSTEQFEEFYFRVCTLDYGRMSEAMEPLKQRMERTDRVRLVGPGTDLRFSIKGIPAVKCEGRRNLPDGECFTAPVKESVEGVISFNTPSLYLGTTFENVRLTFSEGKVVQAEGSPQKRLEEVLGSDEGARYVGEFSLGFNPYITRPMKDTLFDEKIAGSLHFTPGSAYDIADNGNRSQIHWDLVLIQTPEFGGGEVWFDGERVRKDGRFVVPELEGLNPEALTGSEVAVQPHYA